MNEKWQTTSNLQFWTHHSHGLRVEHLLRGECGEVRQIGQDVHGRHDGQRDDDGTRKVPEDTSKYTHQVGLDTNAKSIIFPPLTLTCKRQSFPP